MLSFEFTPTKQDYLKAFRSFYLAQWKEQALLLSIPLIMFACTLSAVLQGELGEFRNFFLALFGSVFFFLFYAIVISPFVVANKVAKDERLNSPVLYELNDEHIQIKNKFTETKFDWGSFQRIIESEEYFLIIYTTNKNMFQIVPKRAFSTSDDEKEFRNLVKEKIHTQNKNAPLPEKKPTNNTRTIILIIIGTLLACAAMTFMTILQNT